MTIGLHTGINAEAQGLEEFYLQPLDASGIPSCVKFVDDVLGAVQTAQEYPHARIILRFTRPSGFPTDLPDYNLTPEVAASEHWHRVRLQLSLSPELTPFKDRIWVETCNEPDKGRMDWLGAFAYHYCLQANDEGWKVIPFSFNAGEPEPDQWRLPHVQQFLQLAGERPDQIAVGLHEAKITRPDWKDENGNPLTINSHPENWYNWLIGRYEWLFGECDSMGIKKPTVFLTEWAFDYQDVPEEDVFRRDIIWLLGKIQEYPEVRGLLLWNLQKDSKWANLPFKLRDLIPVVGEVVLENYVVSEPGPDPIPEPTDTLEEYLWEVALQNAPTNNDAALQRALIESGYAPYAVERWYGYQGVTYATQVGIDWTTGQKVVSWCIVPDWGNVKIIVNNPPSTALGKFLRSSALEDAATNEDAALQIALFNAGYVPYAVESWYDYAGDKYAVQLGIDWASGMKVVSYCKVPDWAGVQIIFPADVITVPIADSFEAPIGTVSERATGDIWPGAWTNANPYGNYYALNGGFAYHTGADLNLNYPYYDADDGKDVVAIANGLVTFAGFLPVWGNVVIVKHTLESGQVVYSRSAHLSDLSTSKGTVVLKGHRLGYVGGVEVGYPNHLHFDISLSDVLSYDPGHWPGLNLSSLHTHYTEPEAFLIEHGESLDMADYFLPPEGKVYGPSVLLVNNWGQGPEWQQVQTDNGLSYVVKNSQFECREIGDELLYILADTSPGNGEFYLVDGPWIPRFWGVGDEFIRTENVQFYYKSNCQPVPGKSTSWTTRIRFNAFHETYDTEGGISFSDVIELQWIFNGAVEETYLYAPHIGLIEWRAKDGRKSYANELDPNRGPSGRENIACIGL